jgi:sugar phosphate permease
MTQQERRGWVIVVSLFAVLLLIAGSGANTFGIFLPALLKAFPHWSRARVALLPSALFFSWGVSVIPVGWLLDRVEARILMIFGALASGGAFLIASQSNSFSPMIAAYLLLGLGISAGTLAPAAFVLANWFEARRGLAMGIMMSGTTAGGMAMTLVANHVIADSGWRTAYVVLGVPMIVVVVPLTALVVRSRPPWAVPGAAQQANEAARYVQMTVAQGANLLEGFEASEALRTRSFWMLVIAHFCFGLVAVGMVVHLIAYLEGLGYKASSAALAMSILFGLGALGKVLLGHVADRIGARLALVADFAAAALAFLLVFDAARVLVLAVFILAFGMAAAAPVALLPLLVAESLGRKRFGVLAALTGIAATIGATTGPVIAGRIFDITGGYADAFELFILADAVGALATFVCQSYAQSARVRAAPAPASA